jgi:hypothetical protein
MSRKISTKTVVAPYTKKTPHIYRKSPEVMDVVIDGNNCAEILHRGTRLVVRVANPPTLVNGGIIGDIAANIRELLS